MSAGGRKEPLPTTILGRLVQARCLKQEGNELFRAKEWKKAVKKYHHALMFCKGITDKLDFIPGLAAAGGVKPTQEEEREATELSMAVTNNLAGTNLLDEPPQSVFRNVFGLNSIPLLSGSEPLVNCSYNSFSLFNSHGGMGQSDNAHQHGK